MYAVPFFITDINLLQFFIKYYVIKQKELNTL